MNASWDNLENLHLFYPCVEGIHRVPEAKESMFLALVHAIQMLAADAEHGINKPPIGDLFKLGVHEIILFDNLCPHCLLPRHGICKLEAALFSLVARPFDAELVCQHRPEKFPLVEIPVAAIKCLILGEWLNGGPDLVFSDEIRIGRVTESLPGDPGSRPSQHSALLAADGGINAQAADDIHGASGRESEDDGGAVHGPADGAVAAGDLVEEDVLQVVVEVGAIEAEHVLGEGRVRGGDLADDLEWSDVVLAAGLEADVDESGAVGDDDGEDVAEHGGVHLAVLGLRGVGGPGDVEDVGDVGEGREDLGNGGGVGEVEVEVGDGGGGRRGPGRERAAGDGVDLPGPARGVLEREDVEEGGADDARGADDEGDALEGRLGGRRVLFLPLLHCAYGARPPPAHGGSGSVQARGRTDRRIAGWEAFKQKKN